MAEFKKQFQIVKIKYIEQNGTIDKTTYQRLYNRTRRQYDIEFKNKKIEIYNNYVSNNKDTFINNIVKCRIENRQEYLDYQKQYRIKKKLLNEQSV